MMVIAPISSITAIASSSALSATGTRGPSSERMPSAKAMSVAAGIAQPEILAGLPMLRPTKISAGMAIPPIAATSGSEAWFQLDSWPSTTSRFTSSPTRKKNTAISPSLIHSSSGLSIAKLPTATLTGVSSAPK